MKVFYNKTYNDFKIILYKTEYGGIDFRCVQRNEKKEFILDKRIQLSNINSVAQQELNEMFSLYKVPNELIFDIAEVTKDMKDIKRI